MNNEKIKQAAKIAFYGGLGSDSLNIAFPNGCTLAEAITYFIDNKDEFYAIGFIK